LLHIKVYWVTLDVLKQCPDKQIHVKIGYTLYLYYYEVLVNVFL